MKPVRIGPFEIHEAVGKGGMGVVHRGVYVGPGEPVPIAIKFVTPPQEGDRERFRDAFIREAQSAARLHHPNIVGVYDIGVVDEIGAVALDLPPETAFLVMEFVDSGTLEDQVGNLQWHDLRDVLLQLLDALAHAHALGIVHRDLKPANVLCTRDENGRAVPLLTDFGIARAMDTQPDEAAEDEPQKVAGTPYYMAPEHVMGRWRDEGPWTDVYALGALAWHLSTGTVPFAGNTGEVLRAHLIADLPVFTPHIDVPDEFESWVRRLLDKDLTQRFRRAADAAWALMKLPETLETRSQTRKLRALVADPGPTLQGLTGTISEISEISEVEKAKPQVNWKTEGAVRKGGLAPPLPLDWRRGDEDERRSLAGAGLGLFGLRPVPIVGRDEDRTRLWRSLHAVHATHSPRGAVVTGVPGTGKSRMVEWLGERADEVGGAILFRATHSRTMGNADGLVPMMARFTCTQGLGFESVIMRVRALYSDLELRGEDVLFDAVALTERILGRNPEKSGGPRFQSRREWFSALYRLLGGLTRERPILLWLDDAQWGEESLEFARYVLSGEDDDEFPVFIVLTCPEPLNVAEGDSAPALLDEIESYENVESIHLDPLDDGEMANLVERMLGLEPELAALVTERTAGNPLFAVQIVEDWVARGVLRLTPDGFAVAEEQAVQLPADVHAAWMQRVHDFVDRFEQPRMALHALAVGATLGGIIQVTEWKAALDDLEIELPVSLASFIAHLVGAGLMVRNEPGVDFVHGLLRESLLQPLEDLPADAVHTACARALQLTAQRPYDTRRAGRVATQWLAAGVPQPAFDAMLESVIANRDFAEHAALLKLSRRALALVDRVEAEVEGIGSLALNSATALRHLGEVEEAREYIDLGWETVCAGASADTFILEPDATRNPLLASMLAEEAILVFETEADLFRADELLEMAQALGTAVDDPVSVGWASKVRSRILCTMGRNMEGVEAARVAVDHYARLKQTRPDFYFSGLCELAGALRVAGRFDEALAAMEEAELWADDVGSREALALAAMESAELARALERYDEARGHYRECKELFDALGGKNLLLVDLNFCLVDIESGELERPIGTLLELRSKFPETGMEGFTALVDLGLAACAAAAGDEPRFESALKEARLKLLSREVRDQEMAGLATVAAKTALDAGFRSAASAWELAQALGGPDSRPGRRREVEVLARAFGTLS